MSSSSSAAAVGTAPVAGWAPSLDLTPRGLSRFDPGRVQQAVEEGWQEGFEAGRAEAAARAQEALDTELAVIRQQAAAVLERLARTVDDLAAGEQRAADAFSGAAATAAVALAEAILGRALADEVLGATAAAERALAALGGDAAEAVLRLHPSDLSLLGETATAVRLVADPSLARGDAVAETPDRTVDARIATALRRALAVLDGTEGAA